MPAFPKPSATETDPVAGPNLTTHAALTTTAHGGIVASTDARLTDTRTPTDASVTAAKVADALKPSVSAAAGTEALRALGTTATTAAAGNDSRLSDARTPTAHKSTHATGGSDALAPSDIGAATSAAVSTAQSTADTAVALVGTKAAKASNLSDLTDASAARTNLGLLPAALECMTMAVFAHSYYTGYGCSPNASPADRVAKRLGLAAPVSRATSGERLMQQWGRMVTGSTPWTVGSRGIVLIQDMINDVRIFGNSAAAVTGYLNTLKAMLYYVSAATKVESSDATFAYTGSWATLTNSYLSGGSSRYTLTSGDYVDVTFSGDAATFICYGFAPAITAGTIEVSLRPTGTVLATVNPNSGCADDQTGNDIDFAPLPIAVSGLGSGSHTVRIKQTSTGIMHVDCVLLPSTTPPKVIVVKDPKSTNWTYYGSPAAGGYNNGSDAGRTAFAAAVDTAVALFSNAAAIDLETWDSSLFQADGTHPTDKGMAHIADLIEAQLRTFGATWANGLNYI